MAANSNSKGLYLPAKGRQWEPLEFSFPLSTLTPKGFRLEGNPYTEISLEARFVHESGFVISRPGFWCGDDLWKVRFVSPLPSGRWVCSCSTGSPDHPVMSWNLDITPSESLGRETLRISPGGRNVITYSGKSVYLTADTGWAIPFRATLEETTEYAEFRKNQGFNAVLLMTLQPDMLAEGTEDRTATNGFARAFGDLPAGRLEQLRPDYFEHLDQQVQILRDHGLIPIFQPVFHGFGWKGQSVAGLAVSSEDYARYCRYLVARYGAGPAIWLPGADASGYEENVAPAGVAIQTCDAYGQPIGLHYNPWKTSDAHWNEPWCSFHLLQTGHEGHHRPDRVATLYAKEPPRAVANGEPTYEGMGGGKYGMDVWQIREAWLNLMCGGTLGSFYGAASLWQWKRSGETAWGDWAAGPWDWRGGLHLPGAKYVGFLGSLLQGLDIADMAPRVDLARGRYCVAKEGSFALVYLEQAEDFHFMAWEHDMEIEVYDPIACSRIYEGRVSWESANAFMGVPVSVSKLLGLSESERRPMVVRFLPLRKTD